MLYESAPICVVFGLRVAVSERISGRCRHERPMFARYDQADPSKTLDPTLQDTYYNVGVEFPIVKGVKLSTVYKHTDRNNDSKSVDAETNEFGVWGEFRF
jgi:hypothetical protein